MRKSLTAQNLNQRPAARTLLALSLAISMAAFGCTTNTMRSNGEPSMGSPAMRSTPTSNVPSGLSSGGNPPMTSSYTGSTQQALPKVSARSRADQAAAIMAQHQANRGTRYLGIVNPPATRQTSPIMITGQFQNPAYLTSGPQLTVNSSINSPGVAGAIGSGTGLVDGGAAILNGATTIDPASGAAVVSPSAALAPTTALSTTATPGAFATGVGPTTALSSTFPGPTALLSPATVTNSSGGLAITPSNRTTTAPATTSAQPSATASGSVASPVRISTGTDGRTTISNVGSSTSSGNNNN